MTWPFVTWLIVLVLIALMWVSRHFAVSKANRQRVLSPESPADLPGSPPRLSVLVAAKDEEANIESCINTLFEQDYPNLEVIVINDRSSDRTAGLLDGLQTRHGDRLKVRHIRELPDGWFGKNHAMHCGMSLATGDWFCFTDADCRQVCNRTLSVAMAEALEQRVDFLSVLPTLETCSFWERLIQPVCAAVMIYWHHPDRVNDPRRLGSYYANGAFMLMNRKAYETIGGHQEVRTQLNEDVHMARLAKARNVKLRVIASDRLYLTRMYANLGQMWRGWSRIFRGSLDSWRRLMVGILILVIFSIAPWASFVAATIGVLTHGPADAAAASWRTIWWAALVAVTMQQSMLVRFYAILRIGVVWSLGYIVGAIICVAMLCNAALQLAGATRTNWRGTMYRAGRHESEQDDAATQDAESGAALKRAASEIPG